MIDSAPHLHQHFIKFAAFEGAMTQERVDEIVEGMQVAANESGDCRVGSLETAVHAGCKVRIEADFANVIVGIAKEQRHPAAVTEGDLERIGQSAPPGQIRLSAATGSGKRLATKLEFGRAASQIHLDQVSKPVFRLDGGLVDNRLNKAMPIPAVDGNERNGAKIISEASDNVTGFVDCHPTAHGWRPCRTRADQESRQVGVSKRSTFPPGLLPCLSDGFGDIRATHADRLPCETTEHGTMGGGFSRILILQCHGITLPF
jgi:hypothetical protein